MNPPLRIVKVGGSLFALEDLGERLRLWLAKQPPATNVLLAGGGRLANAVREWDRRFELGEEAAHWLCVDLLDSTARVLQLVLDRAQVSCQVIPSLGAMSPSLSGVLVFAPSRFLRDEEPALAGVRLPATWETTSDSVAARLAAVTSAAELVLLKSSLPEPSQSHDRWGGQYFDAHFPMAAAGLPQVRFVDLTRPDFPEVMFAQPP